jgi:hypothetical protein
MESRLRPAKVLPAAEIGNKVPAWTVRVAVSGCPVVTPRITVMFVVAAVPDASSEDLVDDSAEGPPRPANNTLTMSTASVT